MDRHTLLFWISIIVACGYQPSGSYRGRHCDIEDVFLAAGHVANGAVSVTVPSASGPR